MKLIPPPGAQQFSYLPAQTEAGEIDSAGLRASIRWPVRAGVGMVMLFVAAFGGWAATAPLAQPAAPHRSDEDEHAHHADRDGGRRGQATRPG